MIKLDYNQARKVHKLIRKECCNCVENNCVLMDDVCVQLISQHNIYCNYFLRAVLPLDKNLSAELLSENAKRSRYAENISRLKVIGRNTVKVVLKNSAVNICEII